MTAKTDKFIRSAGQARRPALKPADAELSKADVKDIKKRTGGVIAKVDTGAAEDCKKSSASAMVKDSEAVTEDKKNGRGKGKENRGNESTTGRAMSEGKKSGGKAVTDEEVDKLKQSARDVLWGYWYDRDVLDQC